MCGIWRSVEQYCSSYNCWAFNLGAIVTLAPDEWSESALSRHDSLEGDTGARPWFSCASLRRHLLSDTPNTGPALPGPTAEVTTVPAPRTHTHTHTLAIITELNKMNKIVNNASKPSQRTWLPQPWTEMSLVYSTTSKPKRTPSGALLHYQKRS